jgi:ubiquinone/menaquinone biosynthesis C-methylase UbiE
MTRLGLAARALRLTVARATADPTMDYDFASGTYDQEFTSVMGPHSVAMLDQVRVPAGGDAVELACGTGHLTRRLADRLGAGGSLRVVEKSGGMLDVARAKVTPEAHPQLRLSWQQGDMLEFLSNLPSQSADVVVCGWAICYTAPVRLLREAARVLRPGGQVGLIETRADALAGLRQAFEQVVTAQPRLLVGLPRLHLPSDGDTMRHWLHRADLRAAVVREGEQAWPSRSVGEALEWVQHSGAGAGFRDSFDMSRESEVIGLLRDGLTRLAGPTGQVRLSHAFVAGIAEKPADAPGRTR